MNPSKKPVKSALSQFYKVTRKALHKSGWDLQRLSIYSNSNLQVLKILDYLNIDTVLDIGADTGDFFAKELLFFGYKGRIISFEPLSDAYRELNKAASRDSRWFVHKRSAIGDFDGEVEINIAGNSQSSSILSMTSLHSFAEERSAYIGKEKVAIAKLDTVAPSYISDATRLFVKIDTQGFEWQVLDGARETLQKAKGVMCEVSLVPLYESQHLWTDILNRLESEGFTLWSLQPGFVDPRNGQTLQLDAILIRQDNEKSESAFVWS
jgi:FkbM family methyltransferase